MKLETDLNLIKRLARVRQEENLDFRAYLIERPFPVRSIDATVHDTVAEVASRIDCTRCANCCHEKQPVLGLADIRRLARATDLPRSVFSRRYLKPAPGAVKGMVFANRPCPFLKNNHCSVYAERPGDCRSYPHLHRRDFVRRMRQAISNYGECPIVFNVYERLKQKLAVRIKPQKS